MEVKILRYKMVVIHVIVTLARLIAHTTYAVRVKHTFTEIDKKNVVFFFCFRNGYFKTPCELQKKLSFGCCLNRIPG